MRKILVIIESPYAGDVATNLAYARACLRDSLERGEAPIASHLLHTQVLDDTIPADRECGIDAGTAWIRVCDLMACYIDKGYSQGMVCAARLAHHLGKRVVIRSLLGGPQHPIDVDILDPS